MNKLKLLMIAIFSFVCVFSFTGCSLSMSDKDVLNTLKEQNIVLQNQNDLLKEQNDLLKEQNKTTKKDILEIYNNARYNLINNTNGILNNFTQVYDIFSQEMFEEGDDLSVENRSFYLTEDNTLVYLVEVNDNYTLYYESEDKVYKYDSKTKEKSLCNDYNSVLCVEPLIFIAPAFLDFSNLDKLMTITEEEILSFEYLENGNLKINIYYEQWVGSISYYTVGSVEIDSENRFVNYSSKSGSFYSNEDDYVIKFTYKYNQVDTVNLNAKLAIAIASSV